MFDEDKILAIVMIFILLLAGLSLYNKTLHETKMAEMGYEQHVTSKGHVIWKKACEINQ